MNPTENLTFELSNDDNYKNIYRLFKDDENSFIPQEYKNEKLLDSYYFHYKNAGDYSSKRSSFDWLVKSKITSEYVGLLHLYDLSNETFNDNHKKCSIGFLTAQKYRGKGVTSEAVNALMKHVFSAYEINYILAYTEKENLASQGFLLHLGFEKNEKDYKNTEYIYFVKVKRSFHAV